MGRAKIRREREEETRGGDEEAGDEGQYEICALDG